MKKAPLKINARHHRTSVNFEHWLEANPKASKKRKFEAFNTIADAEYDEVRNLKLDRVSKKLVKRI